MWVSSRQNAQGNLTHTLVISQITSWSDSFQPAFKLVFPSSDADAARIHGLLSQQVISHFSPQHVSFASTITLFPRFPAAYWELRFAFRHLLSFEMKVGHKTVALPLFLGHVFLLKSASTDLSSQSGIFRKHTRIFVVHSFIFYLSECVWTTMLPPSSCSHQMLTCTTKMCQ